MPPVYKLQMIIKLTFHKFHHIHPLQPLRHYGSIRL